MRSSLFFTSLIRITASGILLLTAVVPLATHAASTKPTCSLTVTTPIGEVTMHKEKDVLLKKGDDIEIEWESKNVKKAFDGDGDAISLSGSATSSPTKNTRCRVSDELGYKVMGCFGQSKASVCG